MTNSKNKRIGLIRAELLKLRRRRGLVLASFALTVVPMLIAYTVLLVLHASNPSKYGPAGGLGNLSGSLEMLALLSSVAGVLVGSTLGAGDLGAGVFRELVVTGRSRWSLFAARIPGGLVFLLPFALLGFAVTAAGSTVFAGAGQKTASLGLIVQSGAWLTLVTAASVALALGVSSLSGSRGTSIGILLAWQLAVSPLLLAFTFLGRFREGVLEAATQRLVPAGLGDTALVSMSAAAAVAVVAAWIVVPLVLGAWRTATRDA